MKHVSATLETLLGESNMKLQQKRCDGGDNVMNAEKGIPSRESNSSKQKEVQGG